MKGYRLNSDKIYVSKIIDGIERKNGHCPCRVNQNDTTLCPCDEFISKGICKCNLFLRFEKRDIKW